VIGLRIPVILAAALVVTACATPGGPGQAGTPKAAKTVELTLIAGKTTDAGGFNFNGYSNGKLTLTVPIGWTVVLHYQNGSVLRHSFDVIPFTGKQPDPPPPPPAFKGAATKDPVSGIGTGKEEIITFVADKAGKYEFLCGVVGHAPAGMWDYLVVSSSAKAPTIRPTGAAALIVR